MAVPTEQALPVDNVQQLLTNALVDAGIVGIDEAIEQPVLNRAFTQVNWLLAQWARKRWLVYRLQDYSFVSTGAETYAVGAGGTININPRPDRIEYAFVRILSGGQTGDFNSDFNNDFNVNSSAGPTPVDIPLDIIPSHEDYSRIRVKSIGTIPWRVFYDPEWPVGKLYCWPIPQQTIYEIHIGFKVVLPRFKSLQDKVNFPPEYETALNWALVRRLRTTYQMPMDPEVNALARDALNTIRLANSAMSTLVMPRGVRTRQRGYDYRGDQP